MLLECSCEVTNQNCQEHILPAFKQLNLLQVNFQMWSEVQMFSSKPLPSLGSRYSSNSSSWIPHVSTSYLQQLWISGGKVDGDRGQHCHSCDAVCEMHFPSMLTWAHGIILQAPHDILLILQSLSRNIKAALKWITVLKLILQYCCFKYIF